MGNDMVKNPAPCTEGGKKVEFPVASANCRCRFVIERSELSKLTLMDIVGMTSEEFMRLSERVDLLGKEFRAGNKFYTLSTMRVEHGYVESVVLTFDEAVYGTNNSIIITLGGMFPKASFGRK